MSSDRVEIRLDTLAVGWAKVHRDIEVLELRVQPDFYRPPAVIVAGIEGRAFVRAGMHDVRKFIGEVE